MKQIIKEIAGFGYFIIVLVLIALTFLEII